MSAEQTEGSPLPRPDLDPEQLVLVIQIAAQAEEILKGTKDASAEFSEDLSHGDRADYRYRFNGDRQTGTLVVRTVRYPDQMVIAYNDQDKIASLRYQENTFGTYLQTTMVKSPSGDWSALNHYTNDSSGVTGSLKSATHQLEFAGQQLVDK